MCLEVTMRKAATQTTMLAPKNFYMLPERTILEWACLPKFWVIYVARDMRNRGESPTKTQNSHGHSVVKF